MKVAFSWDDGALADLKLFKLHEKYGIPAIFFVPTYNSEGRAVLSRKEIKENRSELISFGGHTKSHKYLTRVNEQEIEEEILSNKTYLEDTLGEEVPHFCLPGGAYDDSILKVAFTYFKTVRTADTMNFRNPTNLCKPSIHVFDRGNKSLFGNALRNKNIKDALYVLRNYTMGYFDNVYRLLERHAKDESTIVVWGHSWEIEEYNLWNRVDAIMKIFLDYRESIVKYDEIFDEF